MNIRTGYLNGNLTCEWSAEDTAQYDEAASWARYGELLEEALRKEFPDAEITVQSQDGVGSMPRPLNTAVYDDSGEYDALAAEVDDIAARVYEAFDWLVKREPMEIQGRYYIPQVPIYQAQIPTGAARRDGRAPSHDGECVWVSWTTADTLLRWIVEDNGGVSYTSETYTDVDVDEEELAEVMECIGEPGNQPFAGSGSEALDLMVLAGWLQPCDEPADE